jgi:2-polyprenyl-3-methyl-5-hydroxy-6-metoxy-1,4-benzoquinol methylase
MAEGARNAATSLNCAMLDPQMRVPAVQASIPITFPYKGSPQPAYRCMSCGYIFFDPPNQTELDTFYQHDYPNASRNWYNYQSDTAEWKVKSRADLVQIVLDDLEVPRTSVLHEFGCAFGGTVAELSRRGFQVSGSELNQGAVAEARLNGNELIFDESVEKVISREHGTVDVIYSFHVIEHFSDPLEFLKSLTPLLSENGIIVLFTPNAFALDPLTTNYLSYPWLSFPSHLHLWTAGSLQCIAKKTDLEVVFADTNRFNVRGRPDVMQLGSHETLFSRHLQSDLPKHRFLGEELVVAFRANRTRENDALKGRAARTAERLQDQKAYEQASWAIIEG